MSNNWNDPNAPQGGSPQGQNPPNQGWNDQPQDAWGQSSQSAGQPSAGQPWDAPQQPADAWGQQPAGGAGAWGQQQPGQPYPPQGGGYYDSTPMEGVGPGGRPLASWGKRALGALVDIVAPMMVMSFISFFIFKPEVTSDSSNVQVNFGSNLSGLVTWLLLALALAALQGATGQTPGRKIAKTQLVDENGVPPTFGKNVLRTLLHIIDNYLCCIGFLFPLWDKQRQTLADKIVKTYVIDVEQGGPINVNQQG